MAEHWIEKKSRLESARFYWIHISSLGYEVVVATSSLDAFARFKAEPDSFALIITDMTMPHITGLELVKRVFAIRPNMPVILCTGFSELITEEKAQALGIRYFLTKPVLRAEMAKVIRKVLD